MPQSRKRKEAKKARNALLAEIKLRYVKPTLLTLPPEIRNRIYEFVLVDHMCIPLQDLDDGPGLLKVNLQIREEAIGIYLYSNNFAFNRTTNLSHWLKAIGKHNIPKYGVYLSYTSYRYLIRDPRITSTLRFDFGVELLSDGWEFSSCYSYVEDKALSDWHISALAYPGQGTRLEDLWDDLSSGEAVGLDRLVRYMEAVVHGLPTMLYREASLQPDLQTKVMKRTTALLDD